MERYEFIKEVGSGSFGSVCKAFCKQNGAVVAIKKMRKKYYSWKECFNLKEFKSLREMNHPNIVKLKEVIRENNVLYFVFEYMECNLYQLMKDRGKPFSESEVRNMCFQVFQGLAYMHQKGYFHRDIKPENLLVSKNIIKIADFGLAREINSQPPLTDYVSTRWYRAPEVLLQSSTYGPSVDMWAMGAIMAELLTFHPLFPGLSMADEIYKICCVIGSPTKNEWSNGLELASALTYQFPQVAGVHLSLLVPDVSMDAIDLITSLCSWNPCRRPTAVEALRHPFFQSCFYIPPSLRFKAPVARAPPASVRGDMEQRGSRDTGYSNLITSNFSPTKTKPSLKPGVRRKLNLNNQSGTKTDDNMNYYVKPQPKYQPPGMNGTSGTFGTMHGVSDVTEKLVNMKLHSAEPLPKPAGPPSMKSGGCHQQPNLFYRQQYHFLPGKGTYTRKVA